LKAASSLQSVALYTSSLSSVAKRTSWCSEQDAATALLWGRQAAGRGGERPKGRTLGASTRQHASIHGCAIHSTALAAPAPRLGTKDRKQPHSARPTCSRLPLSSDCITRRAPGACELHVWLPSTPKLSGRSKIADSCVTVQLLATFAAERSDNRLIGLLKCTKRCRSSPQNLTPVTPRSPFQNRYTHLIHRVPAFQRCCGIQLCWPAGNGHRMWPHHSGRCVRVRRAAGAVPAC
jgi:hypothetical protein